MQAINERVFVNQAIEFKYNDGGRKQAGYKGDTGDCVTRAIAIATGKPYQEVYDMVFSMTGNSPRKGVKKVATRKIMASLGWTWVPVMGIGTGCKMHLCYSEVPTGTLVCKLSKHIVAVIDRVVQDTYDPSRQGTRCVYGYWKKI